MPETLRRKRRPKPVCLERAVTLPLQEFYMRQHMITFPHQVFKLHINQNGVNAAITAMLLPNQLGQSVIQRG